MLPGREYEYYPELVPVFEDYEHATNIIRIEDLVEYATSNNRPLMEQILSTSNL